MLDLIPAGGEWKGTSKELLAALNAKEPQHEKKPGWPGTARAMNSAVRTIAPNLRAVGFTVPEQPKKVNHGNVWHFTRAPLEEEETPPPHPPQEAREPKQSALVLVDVAVYVPTSTPTSTAASPDISPQNGGSGGRGGADAISSNGHHPAWEPRAEELESQGMDPQEALAQAVNEAYAKGRKA
jgi:hypothetical protein